MGSILVLACLSVRSSIRFKARVFEIPYIDSSSIMADHYFFFCPNYLPLWSDALLKSHSAILIIIYIKSIEEWSLHLDQLIAYIE